MTDALVLAEVRRLRVEPPSDLPPPEHWPLHLKHVTLARIDAILALETTRESTKDFPRAALQFMEPQKFFGRVLSLTIKTTQLLREDLELATR